MKKTVLSFIFLSSITLAHEGPAYPLLVDRPLDSKNSLSIWADPDTDKGTFDLFIEGDVQTNYQIHLSAAPANDPSHVLMAWALPLKRVGTRQNFRSVLPFDRELVWNVEFVLKQNEGAENTFTLPVEVTPPGPNIWEFAIYFLPFLLAGLLWIKVVLTKRKISP